MKVEVGEFIEVPKYNTAGMVMGVHQRGVRYAIMLQEHPEKHAFRVLLLNFNEFEVVG